MSWAAAPTPSKPPASPPVAAPRLRICAPTRSQVQHAGLPTQVERRTELASSLGSGLGSGLRSGLSFGLGFGFGLWYRPLGSRSSRGGAGGTRTCRPCGWSAACRCTCERVGAQILSPGAAFGGLAGGFEGAGAAAQDEVGRPGPWLWQAWPCGAAAGEGGRRVNRLEGTSRACASR